MGRRKKNGKKDMDGIRMAKMTMRRRKERLMEGRTGEGRKDIIHEEEQKLVDKKRKEGIYRSREAKKTEIKT